MSDKIISIEPVTRNMINGLRMGLTSIAREVSGLNDVDISRGRGVLGEREHCLWTTKGHRVTVSVLADGGVIASKSKEPDPEAPKGAF